MQPSLLNYSWMLLYQMQTSMLPFPHKYSHWSTSRLEKPQETGTDKVFHAVAQSYKCWDVIKTGGFIIPQLV